MLSLKKTYLCKTATMQLFKIKKNINELFAMFFSRTEYHGKKIVFYEVFQYVHDIVICITQK